MRNLLLALSIIYSSCAIAQNSDLINVHIKQIESELPIELTYDTVNNRVWTVLFPFEYEIKDKTPTGTWVRDASFYYPTEFSGFRFEEAGWTSVPHWMKFDGKYVARPDPTELNGKKYPTPGYFLIYTKHRIQERSDIQDSLAQYIPELKKFKVYIGTLREFKAKHPKLTERFLKGDSVSIRGYNKRAKHYESIRLPIEY